MKRYYFLFLFFPFFLFAQEEEMVVDEKYREDQLYIDLTYNALLDKPSGIHQNGLSGGISLGFIRDIPLNKKRNVGLGIGLGYGYNAYNQNLKITEVNNTTQYTYASDAITNRIITHAVEMPIEFRWRTSTPTVYKFWRVYTGFKVAYLFANSSKFEETTQTIKVHNIKELSKLQYGATVSVGYSSWNLHVYYGLNTQFKEAFIEQNSIKMKELRVGLIFYIL